jgi:hypothetical protein
MGNHKKSSPDQTSLTRIRFRRRFYWFTNMIRKARTILFFRNQTCHHFPNHLTTEYNMQHAIVKAASQRTHTHKKRCAAASSSSADLGSFVVVVAAVVVVVSTRCKFGLDHFLFLSGHARFHPHIGVINFGGFPVVPKTRFVQCALESISLFHIRAALLFVTVPWVISIHHIACIWTDPMDLIRLRQCEGVAFDCVSHPPSRLDHRQESV